MQNIWSKIKKPILALAPMTGYTDPAFRLICLQNKADVVYTEMVSVEGIWRKNAKTLKMLRFLPNEKNVILQLFGSRPKSFKKALQVINDYYNSTRSFNSLRSARDDISALSGIDLNFGCPARKVTKTGAGALLMNNKKLAREIIQTVLKNTKLPVSIKIRSQVKNTSAIEFVEFIKDLPISSLMIHGRSLKQGFSGKINFEIIKKVKQLLPEIPVLANGGINTVEDAKNILEKTNADGIGIARGALGNPFIFDQIKKYSKNKKYKITTQEQIKKTITQHSELFLKYNKNLIPLRKHLLQYFKGQKNASEIRQKIIKIKTLKELKKIKI